MILSTILNFIIVQLLQALITAQMIKDVTLDILKAIATHTKTKFDDHIYKRVKFYFEKDKSEHLHIPEDPSKPSED